MLNAHTSGSLEEFFRLLGDADTTAATDLVLGLLDEGTPVDVITHQVLVPAQVRVGQMWERGDWSVADEHAATAVTESALMALAAAARTGRPDGRHLAVVCAEGEWHTLPARMAATIASAGGLRVTMLGPSLPAEHVGRRLRAGDVDLLALSCTLPTNLVGAARTVAAAHDAGVPVTAGGRAFGSSPQRAHAIGADAWASDPTQLLAATPALAGRPSHVAPDALLLDAVTAHDTTVDQAYQLMVAAFPRLTTMDPAQTLRTREDLAWMARFTAAAILTDDDTILHDLLGRRCALLERRVPAVVITTCARLLAEVIEADSPTGSALLRSAAARIHQQDGAHR